LILSEDVEQKQHEFAIRKCHSANLKSAYLPPAGRRQMLLDWIKDTTTQYLTVQSNNGMKDVDPLETVLGAHEVALMAPVT
jgi:hypothetical protein